MIPSFNLSPAQLSPLNCILGSLLPFWMSSKHLKLNIVKTNLLIFHPKCAPPAITPMSVKCSSPHFQLLSRKKPGVTLKSSFFHNPYFLCKEILYSKHLSLLYHSILAHANINSLLTCPGQYALIHAHYLLSYIYFQHSHQNDPYKTETSLHHSSPPNSPMASHLTQSKSQAYEGFAWSASYSLYGLISSCPPHSLSPSYGLLAAPYIPMYIPILKSHMTYSFSKAYPILNVILRTPFFISFIPSLLFYMVLNDVLICFTIDLFYLLISPRKNKLHKGRNSVSSVHLHYLKECLVHSRCSPNKC